ncbi:MAG: ABC transporter permease [Bryobacterales bacterium]|nr:ABC transporter permease [Bryobacterales bacterium]
MIAFLPLILRNSVRNRRRSLLTILSVAASLCLLGVLGAVYNNFYYAEASPDQALRLIVRNRVSLANPFPIAYRARILQVPGVDEAVIYQWFGGVYKDARDTNNFFGRFAVEPDRIFRVYPEFKLADAERLAFQRERSACIVGRKLANRLGFKLGDRVQIVGDIFPMTLELVIRGIYDSQADNENLFFNFEYLNKGFGGRRQMDRISTLVLHVRSTDLVPTVSRQVDDLFRNSDVQTLTESEHSFQLSFLAFLGNVKLFFLMISSAVAFTMFLITANTMAMSVRERTREVGILKTIGFTPSEILRILIGESVTIALIGAAAGLWLATLLVNLLRSAPSTFADLSTLRMPPEIYWLGFASAAVLGLLACFFPAWSASRLSIIDALRVTD